MQYITTPPPVKTQRFRPLTAFLALCVSLVLVQSYLSNTTARTRPELPGCVMLAALPHRRLPGESPVRAVGVAEAVCPNTPTTAAFTLIELSIVLVVIGLLVGGVLVGQNLIAAAEVRAQITQIEKYNSAVNTFRSKFNAIPGDMRPEIAQQFGFAVGSSCDGSAISKRNGDGLIDGFSPAYQVWQGGGEVLMFWQDLTTSGVTQLIEGAFPNSGGAAPACNGNEPGGSALTTTPGTAYIGDYLPAAKIGKGNFVYVYETNGHNWYGLSAIISIIGANTNSTITIPVIQAYNIDKKIDDGLPATGNVQAVYVNGNAPPVVTTAPNAAADNSSTCYNATNNVYSITYNNGSGSNCALSFAFQ